ncbi:MAG TPA: ABC transporter ATP-binding protein [Burkholderiaceae bacterium]|nr:ABC transporter ATP-binding protein [Burkholderiaceae bacterium]
MLELDRVGRSFAGIHALQDVHFDVEPGSITALIGPNGAGKTTLINLVTGVMPPSSGRIRFEGRPIDGLGPHRVEALGIRRTFQTVHLFPGLSVRENLVIGGFRQAMRTRWISILGLPSRDRGPQARRAAGLLEMLGLAGVADEIATDLPYGTQRRVEIARALMGEPRFVLLDEPAAGMNESETRELTDDIRLIREQGVTVFLVEHDMSLVMGVSDKVVVLNFGRLIAQGTPAQVQCHPEVIASYLGA